MRTGCRDAETGTHAHAEATDIRLNAAIVKVQSTRRHDDSYTAERLDLPWIASARTAGLKRLREIRRHRKQPGP